MSNTVAHAQSTKMIKNAKNQAIFGLFFNFTTIFFIFAGGGQVEKIKSGVQIIIFYPYY